jgi:acid phosphatase family membrane protein YuiD
MSVPWLALIEPPQGLPIVEAIRQLFDNAVLAWGLAACGTAQLSKLVIELVVHRRWRPAVLVETGGMPSSHSALITGTTAAIGWQLGFDDPLFALAGCLAFIILYDASGVRRAAGLTATRVNQLPGSLWPSATPGGTGDQLTVNDPPAPGAGLPPLKENLGHTRLEVLIGSLMGPAVALPGLVFVGSPLRLAQALGLAMG